METAAELDPIIFTRLNFHARGGLWHHVTTEALEQLGKSFNDPFARFYYGLGLIMEGKYTESIEELDKIRDQPDVLLGARMALAQAHRSCATVDKETVQNLESQIKEDRKQSGHRSYYFGGLFLYFTEKYDKAQELIEKAIKLYADSAEYNCLKGWNELFHGRDMKGAVKFFDDALQFSGETKKYPDAWLGKAKYFELRKNASGSLEILNQASNIYPNFLPVQIEKMLSLLMLKDWDRCVETAQRCQIIQTKCIEAQKMLILHQICVEGDCNEAVSMLNDFIQTMDNLEPSNWKLLLHMSKLFSRTCNGDLSTLQQCRIMCDRAIAIRSDEAEIRGELGECLRLSGHFKQAMRTFKDGMDLQHGTAALLSGLVRCHIAEGEIDEAAVQLDFLREIHTEIRDSAEFKYLNVLIMKSRNVNKDEIVQEFNQIVEQHLVETKTFLFGAEYLIKLNPSFMLEVVECLLSYAPVEPAKKGQPHDEMLKLIARALDPLIQAVPGCSYALYLMGKIEYLMGENSSAQNMLDQCLLKSQTFAEAHLLMAQIQVQLGNFKKASQSLEVGLSYNFEVREHPLYHLIKAQIQKRSKDVKGAVQTLEAAMLLPSFNNDNKSSPSGSKGSKFKLDFTNADRVALYLDLIDSYQSLGRTEEAAKLMSKAESEFSSPKEKQMLAFSNAELCMGNGNIDKALGILKSIQPDQPHYLQARQKMADVYLNHKKDHAMFLQCYKELIDKNPTPEAYVMLGDAHMDIQEPEKAIQYYESALKKNPKDHDLASKIGQAYIRSHNYAKAVAYYEAAMKSGQQNFLRHDLAELLLQLKQYDKCQKILSQGIEKVKLAPRSDISSLVDSVKFEVLLSKLHQRNGNTEKFVESLYEARDNQSKVIKRGVVELADSIRDQRTLAAEICTQLAEHYQSHREFEKAIKLYKEAATFDETNAKILHALSYLYMLTGELDQCERECQALLKFNPEDENANLMLADLMYQRMEPEEAMFHFDKLVKAKPCHYDALARVVELLWRTGRAENAEGYLKAACASNPRATVESGYNYCQGLYEWYTGDPNAALQCFHQARRDPHWGERALHCLIEICMNPDNQIIGGEVFEQGEAVDNTAGSDSQDANEMGVKTAQKFLEELLQRYQSDYKTVLIENFVLLASKNRSKIEQALANFTEMVDVDDGTEDSATVNVGAVLGIARAHHMLKQSHKAKQQLKRIRSHQWNFEDAQYLEQCWLLLADTYINQNKYDIATEILQNCLEHNLSCLKAFEYLGFIKEKEQKWSEAAENYEQAWKLSKMRNAVIGFKLAFNYMKSKRLVDAIDVCHRVLEIHPNYPKIRKEILDKARANLRI